MENLRFMVVLCVYSAFGSQELETTARTKKNHQKPRQTTKATAKTKKNKKKKNTIFKLFLKIKNSWFFLVFTVVLVVNSSKPPQKPRNTTNSCFWRDGSKIVCFFFFLGFCGGFGGLSWLLVVFLGFYGCFGGQQLETTAKTKKHHEFLLLRDRLKLVVFLVFLGFCGGFGGLSWFLVVFLSFCGGFGSQELETTTKTKKNHQKPRQTTKTTAKTEKNQRKNHFRTISPKARIRGVSWFLQWFWWSRTGNHRKNQETRILGFER